MSEPKLFRVIYTKAGQEKTYHFYVKGVTNLVKQLRRLRKTRGVNWAEVIRAEDDQVTVEFNRHLPGWHFGKNGLWHGSVDQKGGN